ncbi:unnamed protein product [Lactuca virosa]|uniref:Uncharacterized protein n=1 Tax=Lactuca virosa TaxID=75947 RepID=A0AAU9LHM0_9ASTR|nr:unnamed protein product [Lactuca virosa]
MMNTSSKILFFIILVFTTASGVQFDKSKKNNIVMAGIAHLTGCLLVIISFVRHRRCLKIKPPPALADPVISVSTTDVSGS